MLLVKDSILYCLFTFTDPEAAPENVLPNDKWISQGQVGFTWQPPPEEERNGVIILYEYEIDVNPVALGEEFPDKGFTNETAIIFIELPQNTLFQFRVRAMTSAGAGPYSDFTFAKTPNTDPSKSKTLNPSQSMNLS